MGIYALGTVFVQLALGLNAFITAQGYAKISMFTVLIGAACNIVLDPIFIFGFNMGVRGAALATILSQAVSAAWVLAFLFGKRTTLRIKAQNMRLHAKLILPCVALGLAPFIMQSTESVLNICFNTSLRNYGGDLAVGAMTILSSVMQFAMLPLQGLTQGAQPIISYNFGAQNRSRVKQAVRGHLEFENKNPLPGVHLPNSDLHGNLNLPDTISFGVMWKPMETLSFEAGTVYTVWSNYRSLNIHVDDYGTAYSPKNWRDTWGFNVSAEYKALDWLTLRGGYVFETSPMKDSTCDYMTPSNGRHRITAGVGFNWDQWTVDLAYGYLIIKELSYDKSTADGVLKGRSHNGSSHIAAVSVGYKF